VIVQFDMSQLELELSPVVMSQVAPMVQSTSHEAPQVPMQVEPAPQSTLPVLGMVHTKPALHIRPPANVMHPGPGQGLGVSPPVSPSIAVPLDPHPPITAASRREELSTPS